MLLTYYKFTAGMDIGEIRKPQDGKINFQSENKTYALRLSTLPVSSSESLALRILPQSDVLQLEKLFLFPTQLTTIKEWISSKSGLILLTGPTGSGKTTTLYALLQALLLEQSYQTITLEDPVEKQIDHILQVQVNEKAGMSYQTGLKAALRHDPDILMVGEIRDKSTAQFAFQAALTGHLVLSTLHARDAFGTVHRLMEMGIQKTDLEQTLIAVASLQLLPMKTHTQTPARAAILELLDKQLLHDAIRGTDPQSQPGFFSFDRLRRKAYTYGFIE